MRCNYCRTVVQEYSQFMTVVEEKGTNAKTEGASEQGALQRSTKV